MDALTNRIVGALYLMLLPMFPFYFGELAKFVDPEFQMLPFTQQCLGWISAIGALIAIPNMLLFFFAFAYQFRLDTSPRIQIPVYGLMPSKPIVQVRRKPVIQTEGFVYLLKSEVGFYKIGHAANPNDRIRTFNVKLPFQVEFEHLIKCKDRFTAERKLHKRYADKRLNGEWFHLTADDVAAIKAINEM